MTISFFNCLWFYLFEKCLFGMRFDTSRCQVSFVAVIIPFYKLDYWFNIDYTYDVKHNATNCNIDLIIPYLCDISIIKEVN